MTAQARGQMDAINKQLKAKSIKNIVSSDRIQELPESNAAEAVARIPRNPCNSFCSVRLRQFLNSI